MNAEILREVDAAYRGSDGDATKRLYGRLEQIGPAGIVAVNLFRACKASERAKAYRGRGHRGAAYDRKQWSMDNLCDALLDHGAGIGLASWGWGVDARSIGYQHVLYVDLPTGQVSYHSASRGKGPGYDLPWDGVKGAAAGRIVQWCARLLEC